MGCFDSVIARCPSCNAEVEFQTKVGECVLKRYRVDSVPALIAASVAGDVTTCICGKQVQINTPPQMARVAMSVSIPTVSDDEWD